MLVLILVAVALLLAGACAAALCGRSDRAALLAGTVSATLGSLLGFGASLGRLLGASGDRSMVVSWVLPIGELRVGLDALSAYFLLCIFTVCGLAAVYGAGYLLPHANTQRLSPACAFFNVLVAAMVGVTIARDGVLFLLAWEVMSIASFFLVTFENAREEVRRAGLSYLIASHVGVVLLILFFVLLAAHAGGFGFDAFVASGAPAGAGGLFILALVGFGTKAGFWPLHIWLPDAHPAAPSHVSAVMSGVMIKMGIYGLLRALTFLGPERSWWGAVLLGVGAISGVAGVLHALTEHDLKRLLAYHSVENIGIIALGIGLGILGKSQGHPAIAYLGYGGALLHVLNHGLFKGLLFQGAGSVLHATGTRDIETLGGLARRMPITALTFLVGSAAISGLPPLNGFVSEWLVYVAAFRAGANLSPAYAIAGLLAAPALALIGGLASACFVKAYGMVFLGQARSPCVETAHEAGLLMRGPMLVSAALCVVIGLAGPGAMRLVAAPTLALSGLAVEPTGAVGPLGAVSRIALTLVVIALGLALLRTVLLKGRDVRAAATWGCGYARPTPRMQYTASSFAAPLLAPFALVLRSDVHVEPPEGFFPKAARNEEHFGDRADAAIRPAILWVVGLLGRLRTLQRERIPLYLAYVLMTLLALLGWLAVSLER